MKLTPDIVEASSKILIGQSLTMSVANNRTGELWQSFMPRLKEIPLRTNADLYSLQIYAPHYFETFRPDLEFVKWACTEVSAVEKLPLDMKMLELKAGTYAVFHYKGHPGNPGVFQYIYGQWLPASKYRLDERPHFEVLGEKYKQNSPHSEEEIWIPIKN